MARVIPQWERRYWVPMYLWFGLGLAVVGISTMFMPGMPVVHFGVLFGTVVLVCLLVASIKVSVGADGLVVRSGVIPIPIKKVSPGQIASVEAQVIQPHDWGGWGFAPARDGWAIILRRSPGILVTNTNGRRFAITLPDDDDASQAAAILNSARTPTPATSTRQPS
ncbi:DUF3093 family protein [Propionimicrobium sp. PCR01-08-3]|uniref:DUF3093 family protein n=1 Tax=Propionimicrobium sp. PCR01-08-3 TaxID=3052086 RepID=UPI00255CB629|nr:DUF3093 family protein [Propionimicrobium sp. PCR01-08-3]WIY81466.1 DUF3093 family protein [Propionimicrobium sp. PCR01-08-3]